MCFWPVSWLDHRSRRAGTRVSILSSGFVSLSNQSGSYSFNQHFFAALHDQLLDLAQVFI